MATAALVISLISSSFLAAQNGVVLWRIIKAPPVAIHHKVTRPLYRHVLKPIGKELAK